jgi:hypothetical protein
MRANRTPSGARPDKGRTLPLLCPAVIGIIAATGLVGGRGAQATKASLSAEDPRPLAAAIETLEVRSGVAITYEDPLYVNAGEIADVTDEVRRDLDEYKPGEAPKVLVPKGGTVSIDYDTIPGTNRPADPAAVVLQLVDAYNASGNAGRFRVEVSGEIIHVIPDAFKNKEGELTPQQSVLDAVISLPEEERSGVQTLRAICDAVSLETRKKVVFGTIPVNLLVQHRDRRGWASQRARNVLVELLESSKRRANLSWRLLYDPGTREYALNIHPVVPPTEETPSNEEESRRR